MKIEDVKIEDAADANYVIRKFFNNDFKEMKISQLEQLVLTVYNMGKKNNEPASSESSESPDSSESSKSSESPDSSESPESSKSPEPDETANVNPFTINDRAKAIENIEIANSGEIIPTDTEGTISSVKGDTVSFLFESGEDGEMIETSVLFNKLEKIS